MESAARHLPGHDYELGPARGVALLLTVVVVVCLIALVQSGLHSLAEAVSACVASFVGLAGIYRLLRPTVVVRMTEDGVQYRCREGRWSSSIQSPFVSPWFIGWRGAGLRGFGVFPSQMPAEEFRRLAKCLRLGRSAGLG